MKTKRKAPRMIFFTELTYKDLKKGCVSRGMEFEQVASGDVPTLHNWLHNNRHLDEDKDRINEYDDWVEDQLRTDGNDYLISPSLRLGYLGERKEDEEVKPKKEKVEKLPKAPKEKTTEGIVKGTKKAYTFELVGKGRSLDFIKKRVLKRYPDASEKSIKIWYRSAISKGK